MATSSQDVNTPAGGFEPPVPALSMGAPMLVYPLFLASGAAGLIYEVVWNRMLLNLFGAGIYAVCAVLTAFMAGLALGSWLLGRASDHMKRPFRIYGFFEIGIGLSALLVSAILKNAGALEGWAYQAFGHSTDASFMLTLWRFIFAFCVLIVPTTLMGATLPILSRFLVRGRTHLGGHVSALYATNTFGAVCGTFLAGFVLIAAMGVFKSMLIAVGLNLFAGISAAALSEVFEKNHELPPATQRDRKKPTATHAWLQENLQLHTVLFSAFISGGVALAAQVVWTRALVFAFDYLKNTTYAFSAMLTVFLAGLAMGSGLISLFIDRQRSPLRLYGALLLMMSVFVQLSLVMVYWADAALIAEPFNAATQELNWMVAVGNVMFQSAWVMFLPTLFMGMAFPVAARVVTQSSHVGEDVGRLYAVNTLGAIFGSAVAVFVLIPIFGLGGSIIALGVTYGILSVLVLLTSASSRRMAIVALVMTLVTAGAVYFSVPRDDNGRLTALQPLTTQRDNIVFYEEGPMATVSVIEHNTKYRTIYVDGVGVAGTDPVLQTDQKSLAHVPMMLIDDPKYALTVGFGSGGCSYSLLQHSRLEKIRCVEICKTMVDQAPKHLTDANHSFWKLEEGLKPEEKRYKVIFDDARSYLRYTGQDYSFISTDCTDLRYKSNANLYDLQYFEACKERLTDDGMVIVWMPLAGLSREMFQCALRTFNEVFPNMGVFFMDNSPTHYVLLVSWPGEIKIDYGRIVERLKEKSVRDDLAELNLDDAAKILSCFITGGDKLSGWLEASGAPINTEDNPVIEFESPKYGYQDKPLIDNLDDLMAIRVSPIEFIIPGTATPGQIEQLQRYEKALPWIIKGHAAYREMNLEEATRCYLEAYKYTPEDNSLRHDLLNFSMLARRVGLEPDNPTLKKLLGRVYMLQADKLVDAYSLLERSVPQWRKRLDDPAWKREATNQLSETMRWMREIEQELKKQGRDPRE